jgi:hypothetical protein
MADTDVVGGLPPQIILADADWIWEIDVSADTTKYTADSTCLTADGSAYCPPQVVGEPGGGLPRPRRRPFPVVGYGYGVIELDGEAFGIVIAVVPVDGKAHGAISLAIAGQGIVPLFGNLVGEIRAAGRAQGVRGLIGSAGGQLQGLSVMCKGTALVSGCGNGELTALKANATGAHDDDEAAVMTILLAA